MPSRCRTLLPSGSLGTRNLTSTTRDPAPCAGKYPCHQIGTRGSSLWGQRERPAFQTGYLALRRTLLRDIKRCVCLPACRPVCRAPCCQETPAVVVSRLVRKLSSKCPRHRRSLDSHAARRPLHPHIPPPLVRGPRPRTGLLLANAHPEPLAAVQRPHVAVLQPSHALARRRAPERRERERQRQRAVHEQRAVALGQSQRGVEVDRVRVIREGAKVGEQRAVWRQREGVVGRVRRCGVSALPYTSRRA